MAHYDADGAGAIHTIRIADLQVFGLDDRSGHF